MNHCHDIENKLTDLLFDELPPPEAAAVQAHAATCAACAELLTELRSAVNHVRTGLTGDEGALQPLTEERRRAVLAVARAAEQVPGPHPAVHADAMIGEPLMSAARFAAWRRPLLSAAACIVLAVVVWMLSPRDRHEGAFESASRREAPTAQPAPEGSVRREAQWRSVPREDAPRAVASLEEAAADRRMAAGAPLQEPDLPTITADAGGDRVARAITETTAGAATGSVRAKREQARKTEVKGAVADGDPGTVVPATGDTERYGAARTADVSDEAPVPIGHERAIDFPAEDAQAEANMDVKAGGRRDAWARDEARPAQLKVFAPDASPAEVAKGMPEPLPTRPVTATAAMMAVAEKAAAPADAGGAAPSRVAKPDSVRRQGAWKTAPVAATGAEEETEPRPAADIVQANRKALHAAPRAGYVLGPSGGGFGRVAKVSERAGRKASAKAPPRTAAAAFEGGGDADAATAGRVITELVSVPLAPDSYWLMVAVAAHQPATAGEASGRDGAGKHAALFDGHAAASPRVPPPSARPELTVAFDPAVVSAYRELGRVPATGQAGGSGVFFELRLTGKIGGPAGRVQVGAGGRRGDDDESVGQALILRSRRFENASRALRAAVLSEILDARLRTGTALRPGQLAWVRRQINRIRAERNDAAARALEALWQRVASGLPSAGKRGGE